MHTSTGYHIDTSSSVSEALTGIIDILCNPVFHNLEIELERASSEQEELKILSRLDALEAGMEELKKAM